MRCTTAIALATVALSHSASAYLAINNWCGVDVYFWENSASNGCDHSPTGVCATAGGTPFKVPHGTVVTYNFHPEYYGTSLKFFKTTASAGVLQFEYTIDSAALWWDLSDLDGDGAGLVGTPFGSDNVKVSPTGTGSGVSTCLQIHCPAGVVCTDAYQAPDEKKTRWCPYNTGTMWLDLCEPTANFWSKRDTGLAVGPSY